MQTAGIITLVIGLLWAVFKGYVVWDISHDLYQGGGAPTLDFPVVCPIPLAVGTSLVLSARGIAPFPGFVWALYVGLAALFGFLLWLFDRLGQPERERQGRAIQQGTSPSVEGESE